MESVPDWPSQGPYPLPFHPLTLGEYALRELFGFILEGRPRPADVDADDVHLRALRVSDPSGAEKAEREAAYARVRAAMGPPRIFRTDSDGRIRGRPQPAQTMVRQ